jgi:hypothetical protein
VITAGVRLALSRGARGAPCCQWAELIGKVRVTGGVRITPSGEVSVVATLPTVQAAERLLTTLRAHRTDLRRTVPSVMLAASSQVRRAVTGQWETSDDGAPL